MKNKAMNLLLGGLVGLVLALSGRAHQEEKSLVAEKPAQQEPYKENREKTEAETFQLSAGVTAVLEKTVVAGVMEKDPPAGGQAEAAEQICSMEFNPEECYLLAKIAMAEAEGEDLIGKALVIRTVLNRMCSEEFPDTIEEVLYQEGQFTPVGNGRFDRVEPDEECYAALAMVQNGWDESQGALYFEKAAEESTWHSRNLKELVTYGNQIFYEERKEEKRW